MPNDKLVLEGQPVTVVASVEYRDEPTYIATVLLLGPRTPFFRVAHFYMEPTEQEGEIEPRRAGYVHVLGTFENIVPAVRCYEESGGDY